MYTYLDQLKKTWKLINFQLEPTIILNYLVSLKNAFETSFCETVVKWSIKRGFKKMFCLAIQKFSSLFQGEL